MIVDNNEIVRRSVERLLSRAGIPNAAATGGIEALQLLEQVKPRLILLDVTMPDMTGSEVARQIRANRSYDHIRIFFFTANGFPATQEQARAYGGDDVIDKLLSDVPAFLRQIRQAIE